MFAIRAHFDGSVVVPDEPLAVSPQTPVVVLLDSTDSQSATDLEAATRQYYQAQASQDEEDDAWGRSVARDSHEAWDRE